MLRGGLRGRHVTPRATALAALLLSTVAAFARAGDCGTSGPVAVQILGSGGPESIDNRAGTSALVWVDGKARVLVDLGPGAMLRFRDGGAKLDDLHALAFSHLHVDHSADLPALVKSGYFDTRSRPLIVLGPDRGARFPSLSQWLDRQFGADGAYAYLSGALDGSEGQFALRPVTPAMTEGVAAPITLADGIALRAVRVHHGPVPALAWIVEVAGRTLVFAGDQDGRTESFWTQAAHADLAVLHLAIPEQAGAAARALHAPPSVLGRQAGRAGIRRVVLSHLMARTLNHLDQHIAEVRSHYAGSLEIASDLSCYPVAAGKATE